MHLWICIYENIAIPLYDFLESLNLVPVVPWIQSRTIPQTFHGRAINSMRVKINFAAATPLLSVLAEGLLSLVIPRDCAFIKTPRSSCYRAKGNGKRGTGKKLVETMERRKEGSRIKCKWLLPDLSRKWIRSKPKGTFPNDATVPCLLLNDRTSSLLAQLLVDCLMIYFSQKARWTGMKID